MGHDMEMSTSNLGRCGLRYFFLYFIFIRLDYCNSVFTGLSKKLLDNCS